ncbi:MAG: hypothetical protein AB1546_06260 [bacterium]
MAIMEAEIVCVPKLMDVDAEFVNPFLAAAHDALVSLGRTPAQRGELALTMQDEFSDDVVVELQVEGELHGVVFFCMDEETAKRSVSAILRGIIIEEMDEMAQSSLEEFSIRVSEKAKRQLLKLGYKVNVRSRLLLNERAQLPDFFPFLTVCLTTRCGEMLAFFNLTKTVK